MISNSALSRTVIMLTLFVLASLTLTPAGAASLPQPRNFNVYLSAPAAATTVTVTKAPGTVKRGYTASVAVKTAPRAVCSITVTYKSGPSTAAGLVRKTAPASGVVSWSWKVGTRTTSGSWPVRVTCNGVSAVTYVRVP